MQQKSHSLLQRFICLAAVAVFVFSASLASADDKAKSFSKGKVTLESSGPIAFAPDGVLLVSDPMAPGIVAIETKDAKGSAKNLRVEAVDTKVAALLGTKASEIRIVDLAVSPVSGVAYLSVARGTTIDSPGVIVKIGASGKPELVDLSNVSHSSVKIAQVPGKDVVVGRRRKVRARTQSITDLAYVDGRVLVAGMSNEEFASSLRSIPYPFSASAEPTSIEIYHGAHGRLETNSPVRTFVSLEVAGEPHILAAYQCTPLVSIPLSQLKPGSKVRGKTLAELGNRNRPLDMIVYGKGGKKYMLIANSSRGIMKIDTVELAKDHNVSERVGGGGTAGVPYETVADWKEIHQLDRADEKHALVMRQTDKGSFDLVTLALP